MYFQSKQEVEGTKGEWLQSLHLKKVKKNSIWQIDESPWWSINAKQGQRKYKQVRKYHMPKILWNFKPSHRQNFMKVNILFFDLQPGLKIDRDGKLLNSSLGRVQATCQRCVGNRHTVHTTVAWETLLSMCGELRYMKVSPEASYCLGFPSVFFASFSTVLFGISDWHIEE